MPIYGLIGKKLAHSFSKDYFTKKFKKEGLVDHEFRLFELGDITQVTELAKQNDLKGFNITIPYKETIIPYLTQVSGSAQKVGAVNVVKIVDGQMHGHNSDYYGFKTSLEKWLPKEVDISALVLGTGGASKAVTAALEDLSIPYQLVSRTQSKGNLTYADLTEDRLLHHKLLVNTTPLGMAPEVDGYPELDYSKLDHSHYLYDLVYNPAQTVFLKKGEQRQAHIKNGLEMLHLQADRAWDIWMQS